MAIAVAAACFARGQLIEASKQRSAAVEAQAWSARSAEGGLVLQIDERLSTLDDVHLKLRGTEGAWAGRRGSPAGAAEWARVEAYLGLLERIAVLHAAGVLRLDVVRSLYGYRLRNVWHSQAIREAKLVGRAGDWQDLIALINAPESEGYPVRR